MVLLLVVMVKVCVIMDGFVWKIVLCVLLFFVGDVVLVWYDEV